MEKKPSNAIIVPLQLPEVWFFSIGQINWELINPAIGKSLRGCRRSAIVVVLVVIYHKFIVGYFDDGYFGGAFLWIANGQKSDVFKNQRVIFEAARINFHIGVEAVERGEDKVIYFGAVGNGVFQSESIKGRVADNFFE